MKKKVTIIAHSFPPERGGASSRIYNLAKLLQENNYEVEVICSMPNYPLGKIFEGYKNKIISKENVEGIKIRRYWIYPSNSSRYLHRGFSMLSQFLSFGIFGFFRLFQTKPDLLIVSSPPFLLGSIGTKLGKLLKIKTLLNISDLWPQTAVDMGKIKKGGLLNFSKKREKNMYQRANFFSGQSEEIQQHISQYSNQPFFLYRNLPTLFSENLIIKTNPLRKIVYAGNLGHAQGLLELIQNIDFKKLGTELHIFGEGNEKIQIQNWIAQNPDLGAVFHASIDEKSIQIKILDFDAALIPLAVPIKGAVPSKIFTTIALGIPILYAGEGEAATIIEKNNLGWVNAPKDWETLKKNIHSFLQLSENDLLHQKQNNISIANLKFNKEIQDIAFIKFLNAVMQ